jgi:hypothetical protein
LNPGIKGLLVSSARISVLEGATVKTVTDCDRDDVHAYSPLQPVVRN